MRYLPHLARFPGGRLIAIGTMPVDPMSWFAKLLQNADVGMTFAPDSLEVAQNPFEWRHVRKANPSLNHMPSLRAAIRKDIAAAKLDGSRLPAYLALRLNQGTSDISESVLIDPSVYQSQVVDILPPLEPPIIWGVDLGAGHAMSAIAAYSPQSRVLKVLAAFPVSPGLAERGARDSVGDLYEQMAGAGELIQSGNRTVDYLGLIAVARARFGRPSVIVCDRFRELELRDALDKAGMPPCPIIVRGMGFRDGSEDVRHFRRAVLENKVLFERSLLLTAALSEARVIADPAGNEKLSKSSQGGRRRDAKDDAAAAAILAVSEGYRRGPVVRRKLRYAVVG